MLLPEPLILLRVARGSDYTEPRTTRLIVVECVKQLHGPQLACKGLGVGPSAFSGPDLARLRRC